VHPKLAELFGWPIHTYPVFVGGAFVLSAFLASRDFRRNQLDVPPLLPFWAFLGALLGGRLWYSVQHGGPLWRALLLWEGGIVFFGGLLGGSVVVAGMLLARKAPVLPVVDVAIPYVALGQAIGRLGCFMNGCCWGTPCQAPWAVQFPEGSLPYEQHRAHGLIEAGIPASLPVHPSQLYAALGLMLVFVILKLAGKRKAFHGALILLYLFLYGVLRFVVEFFRDDVGRGFWGFTTAQWAGAILVLIALTVAALMRTGAWTPRRPSAGQD
jgi:phosphatidylglycerol:prolipoprotein diacylglycerol transferase